MTFRDNELLNFNNTVRSLRARERIKKTRFAKYRTNNRVIAPDTIPLQMYGAYGSQALIEASPTTYDIVSDFKEIYVPVNPVVKKYETTPFDWSNYNETLLISRY